MLRRVVVIGDGAKWIIWEHVATTFGSERVEILDWYHCCQHLGVLAPLSTVLKHRRLRHGWTTPRM